MKNNVKNTLTLLAAAASNVIATQAVGAEVTDKVQVGIRHHNYEEEKSKDFTGEDKPRYEIKVNQFSLLAPLSEEFEVSLSYQYEKMSGASPWYTFLSNDKPVQVMSGASIFDKRKDITAGVRYAKELNSLSVGTAISKEDDYESRSYVVSYETESKTKLDTYSISADFSNDKINAVDFELYTTRPDSEERKHSSSILFAYSRVLSPDAIAQFSLGVSRKSGFLSDPYKIVLANFSLLPDSRPDKRIGKTAAFRYRHFVNFLDAAFHLDYRYYKDTWDIKSHTLEVAWYQNLPYEIQLIPSIRAYSQSSAYFYESFYSQGRDDGLYSTDYRLSEYGAFTYGLTLSKVIGNFKFSLNTEKYVSGGDYFVSNESFDNPGLVDFSLVSFGVDFQF